MSCEWNVRRLEETQQASSRIPPTIYRDDHDYPGSCSIVTKDCDTDEAKGRGDVDVGYNCLQYDQQSRRCTRVNLV